MIDLERQADEAELAFIQAARTIQSVKDEEKMKELLGEYLSVLKLMRLKRSVYSIARRDDWRLPLVREAVITHVKTGV